MDWLEIKSLQGLHRIEKYLNLKGFHEKSLNINMLWKVLESYSKAL